ncbi:hypothetical protein INT48_000466 [Thamnidium elegans]|uniref:Uncharacterized protein n=1 Tax=Thamnidium elegans TaxID=101142 RepID=A0A8H7VZM3_9FUNG|nr:hypothetical protein INT48_000466 [Thamnidium elegans]
MAKGLERFKLLFKFWTKKCFLLTADAVSNHFQKATLNPMAALDPTLALVFRIVDNILAKENNDMILKSDTRYFLSQVKRNLEKIIEDSKNQGTSSKRKTMIQAEEGRHNSVQQGETSDI